MLLHVEAMAGICRRGAIHPGATHFDIDLRGYSKAYPPRSFPAMSNFSFRDSRTQIPVGGWSFLYGQAVSGRVSVPGALGEELHRKDRPSSFWILKSYTSAPLVKIRRPERTLPNGYTVSMTDALAEFEGIALLRRVEYPL